jgi:AraC-like DNA-binding protein
VAVDPDPIFVKDGKFYTSAGQSAGLDLALALVEEDAGRDLAIAVAQRLVMLLKRPGGQSQFSAHLVAQRSTHSTIERAHQWILAHLTEDFAVETLAQRVGMSKRNFSRVFRRELGVTPTELVEAARVEAARRALEDTNLPLKRVAALCGFSSTDGMRGAFYRRQGMSAHHYRRTFRATGSAAEDTRQPLPKPTAHSRTASLTPTPGRRLERSHACTPMAAPLRRANRCRRSGAVNPPAPPYRDRTSPSRRTPHSATMVPSWPTGFRNGRAADALTSEPNPLGD